MGNFIEIQKNINCEPCKECGARPVIEQVKGGFIVCCPQNKSHYKTKAGLVNIEDWNVKNKVHLPLGTKNSHKAS